MKKFYLDCDCPNFDHNVIFISSRDKEYGDDLYIAATLQSHRGIWKRICIALRYVFRNDYLSFPYMEAVVNQHNNNKIEDLVKFLNDHLRPVDSSS